MFLSLKKRYKFVYLVIETVALHALHVLFSFLHFLQPFSSYQPPATSTVTATFD